MCYSAMVEQSLKSLGITFQARIQLDLFEELFRRRLTDERLKLPRALEAQFDEPESEVEAQIHAHIVQYRLQMNAKYQAELKKQQERLATAERKLLTRTTKSALGEERIARKRIEWLIEKLEADRRTTTEPRDSRIFPFWYAPVVVGDSGERWVRPMRYHLRSPGKSADYDERYPGLYNARRDNLDGYWRNQFGVHHGIVVVKAFFENVAKHTYEHRALGQGEREENLVIGFRAEDNRPLTVACLWDRWQDKATPELLSFAAITDEPPADVAVTGHDRCVVVLAERNLSVWLSPRGHNSAELHHVLSDRDQIFYVNRRAS